MALERTKVWFQPPDQSSRATAMRLVVVLTSLIIAFAVFLVFTGMDWVDAVANAERTGGKVKLIDLVKTWTWIGVAADLVIALGLLVTLRWWVGRSGGVPTALEVGSADKYRERWLKIGLIALVILSAWIRWPRMGMGFYNDEAHNFVRMTAGELRHSSPETDDFVWKPAKWVETFWYNTAGNNSQPHSILSRLSYTAWKWFSGGADGEVNEIAVRVPAFLVGLGGLWLLGLALGEIAGPRAALLGVLAGALHGWHVRYSTEARGYSLLILGVVVMLAFLQRALRSGGWRHWLGYGAGVLLCVWSFNGSIYFLAVFNALLFVRQGMLYGKGEIGLDQILRPAVAGVFAVVVALPLLLPHLPQLLRVLNEWHSIKGKMGMEWWADVGGYLVAGCRWLDAQPENPINISVERLLAVYPWLWILIGLSVGVAITGCVRLIRLGGASRLLMIATPVSFVLGWALMSRKGNYLHHWYLVYALPWLFCAIGAGLDSISTLIGRQWPRTGGLLVQVLVVVSVLALPAGVAWGFRSLGKQDERAAVIAVRGGVYPHYNQIEHGRRPLFGAFWCNSVIYDPLGVIIRSSADLQTLVRRAQEENRPLYVSFSHRSFAQSYLPEVVQRLESGAEFERAATFYGQEEGQFTSYLFRWKSADKAP